MTLAAGGVANQPPSVNAGPDQSITLPASASLNGTVGDDGLQSPPALITNWSKVSGPGTVSFGNAGAVDTTASFSAAGSYVLRLTASDGALSANDQMTVTVGSGGGGGGTLTAVKRGAIHSSTDASAYSFPSFAATNNRLYVVFLSTSTGTAPAPSATGVSGAGLSFTEIGSPGGVLYSGSVGVRRIQAWPALRSAGATTGPIAITLNGTSLSMDAVLLEFAGVNTSGTNGSGAIVRSVTGKVGAVTSIALTLAPVSSPNNRPAAFFNHRAAEATTPEAGYTELDDATHASPVAGAACLWQRERPRTRRRRRGSPQRRAAASPSRSGLVRDGTPHGMS
jgi:hypothetical protein